MNADSPACTVVGARLRANHNGGVQADRRQGLGVPPRTPTRSAIRFLPAGSMPPGRPSGG